MKMNLLGYTYEIYNSGYNTEMINKQCNAGDPLNPREAYTRTTFSVKLIQYKDVHVKH